jgi:hypothetical protein
MKQTLFNLLLMIGFLSLILLVLPYLRPQSVQGPYNLPKIIWQYWDKDPPSMIKTIKENNAAKLSGWKINYLNENTAGQFISPFDYPPNYNELKPAHKADWLRVYLLKHYGGVWMDASIIINDPKAIDSLYAQSVQQQSELTVFQFKSPLNVENWFIMAPVNSRMVEAWFSEYDSAIRMGFMNYKKILWREGVDTSCGRNEDKIEETYFTQHYALQRIIQNELVPNPTIIVNEAKETMLKIDFLCDGKSKEETKACLIKNYSDFESLRRLPYIKINGANRDLPIKWNTYFETN